MITESIIPTITEKLVELKSTNLNKSSSIDETQKSFVEVDKELKITDIVKETKSIAKEIKTHQENINEKLKKYYSAQEDIYVPEKTFSNISEYIKFKTKRSSKHLRTKAQEIISKKTSSKTGQFIDIFV